MRFYDGNRVAEVELYEYTKEVGFSLDFSIDFYEARLLEYDDDNDYYIVDDIDCVIEQACDLKNGNGDYATPYKDENREVVIIVNDYI